ncbi:MAG: hypothetical protein GDA35_06225, partial [Hyphomonadaceae bacterium]|nr:hypothetical protein [Hyphomonadaceae bacterium]
HRCHQINAKGTREAPITFTSRNDIAGIGDRENATGEWGGIVILGNAIINRCDVPGVRGGTDACENTIPNLTRTRLAGSKPKYGGASFYMTENPHSSGTLEYVTVRHAGFGRKPALTLAGVSGGTTVSYVQVHNSAGDGMRLLGGVVGVDHLILTGNADEQLDVSEGYLGRIEYVVGMPRGDDASDNGIEVRSTAPGVRPQSRPIVHNFTLLAEGNTSGSGVRINTGASAWFNSGIVVDGNTCVDYEETAGDGPGYNYLHDASFVYVLFDCPDLVTTDTENGDDPATFRKIIKRGRNHVASNTLDFLMPGSVERGMLPDHSDRYIGAFSPEETNTGNWAAGWTRDFLPEPTCPAGTVDAGFDIGRQNVCNVSGTVTGELRLTSGNMYALLGRVDIGVDVGADGTASDGDAAALVIESGVTVFGRSGADVIVVNRGSTITALGFSNKLIIFTSEEDATGARGDRLNAAGEWGGLVILGRAPINRCLAPAATGGTAACENAVKGVTAGAAALYGGSEKDDDSGSLRYVHVKYAGSGPGAGIIFGGVGSKTNMHHVQVHNSSGDGIKYFGGTMNSSRVVLTGNGADQLTLNQGYQGSIQYVIGLQRGGGVHGIGVGSFKPGVRPSSNPAVANFTLIGADSARGNGIRVRRGAIGTWLNGIVTGEGACLGYEADAGDGVEGFTKGADPAFRSVLFDCAGGLFGTGSDTTTGQAAVDDDRNNIVTTGTLEGFVNGAAEKKVPVAPVPQGNSFLESLAVDYERDEYSVGYIGAVWDPYHTWWQGWTCGLEESDPC